MRLFILSILAIASVHSLTLGYPYRSALFAYSPGRGEFPVQSAEVQGYLRYFDNNGVERLVSYSHPEPTLGVRHVAGISSPVVRAYSIDSATYPKAIEGHFRAWITVQYNALREEIDALKAQGKEPSADMLFRLQPLEKIYQTADFSTISELPEVKRLFDEHSRIYNVKTELLQQPIGEMTTYTTSTNVPLAPVGETPEQRLAREQHLRIYNEQVARLRQLEAQRDETIKEAQIGQSSIAEQQPINRLAGQADGITEVERATQEHLRLWNEAKLRSEKANYQQEGSINESDLKTDVHSANKQVISAIDHHLSSVVQEPAEILKARAEHLRLVNEATLRVQNANAVEISPQVKNFISGEQQPNFQLRTSIPSGQHQEQQHQQQQQQHHGVVDTAEVVRAREDHLRLVNEARLRAQSVEEEELKHKQFVHVPLLKAAIPHPQSIQPHIPTFTLAAQPAPIADTSEVVKAREEHFRLVNEAQQKAQSIEQTQYVHHDQPQVAETPEVTKARQEHLRIFNEIKSQAEHEQAKMTEIKTAGIELKSQQSGEDSEKIQEQERLNEETRLLALERIREAKRLEEEQKQLELQQLREAERFAEEQRQMEAEIMRLQLEEEQRLEMEKLIESRRLKAEQEQAQQIIITEEFKPIDGQTQQPLLISNPMQQQIIQQQPTQLQMYANNPFFNSPAIEGQTIQQQLQQATIPLAQPQPTIPTINSSSESRKIQSSQNSIGTKQQHIKDDFIKHHTVDHAGYQPADTAAVLDHLEKARQEHFRAHDQVLEQLRLAREQSAALKDCN